MFKLDLEKEEEPEIKLPTTVGLSKKQESSRKTSTSALLTIPKPLTVWVQAPGLKGVSWLVPGPPPRGAPRSSSKLRQLLGSFPAHALQNPEKGR